MTLTDLANHICTQCGMTDTDDVSAAMMFLQRRLEMIWNSALWRNSLLEATLTINPNDTTTLADSYWISERSVLLLPSAIERIIAARINTNALQAASLESYYRAETDWLNYQGTPFEFQVLKPVVMEWAIAQAISAADSNAADATAAPPIVCSYSFSPDGVTITPGTCGPTAQIGTALQLFSFSKPPSAGNVCLQITSPVSVAGITYGGSPQLGAAVNVTQGLNYSIVPGANENGVILVNGTQTITLQTGVAVTVTAQGSSLVFQYPDLVPSNAAYGALTGQYSQYTLSGLSSTATYNLLWGANDAIIQYTPGNFIQTPGAGQVSQFSGVSEELDGKPFIVLESGSGNVAITAQLYLAGGAALTATISGLTTFAAVMASCSLPPIHQRIRLTEAPTVAMNLRVLGKGKCPILGPYDTPPITNVEPALMAFARGDLLLRQRQFGKANLAQQEGTMLLKELVENEAFQQAGEFRIQPEAGFGSDIWWWTQPDSYHPLG